MSRARAIFAAWNPLKPRLWRARTTVDTLTPALVATSDTDKWMTFGPGSSSARITFASLGTMPAAAPRTRSATEMIDASDAEAPVTAELPMELTSGKLALRNRIPGHAETNSQ